MIGFMRYMLTLQWPASSIEDFDALLELENALEQALGASAEVDGHDFGSGQMNVFIYTDTPDHAFAKAQASLGGTATWDQVRAAYREVTGEDYQVLWPPGLTIFEVK
jgi:hypothetical protein